MNHTRRIVRNIASASSIGVILVVTGCGTWNPFGPGFDDGTAGWSRGVRTPNTNTSKMGLDGRSREIEGNLGIK